MIRTYCDVCNVELFSNENRVSRRIIRSLGDVTVEVVVKSGSTWNSGHVCARCVLDVMDHGADL